MCALRIPCGLHVGLMCNLKFLVRIYVCFEDACELYARPMCGLKVSCRDLCVL
jgi:hypothetical protein